MSKHSNKNAQLFKPY